MKKRRKNEDMEYISPNNLIVPSWEWPVSKHEKQTSIISAIVFGICLVAMIVLEKIEYSSSITDFLSLILIFAIPISFMMALTAPGSFLVNKFLRKIKNEEAEGLMKVHKTKNKKTK